MGLFDKYKKSNLNESVDWEKSMDRNDSNLKRIKRLKNLQVDISPVMGDALEDDEKFDKNSKEVFTKLSKDASSTIPKDPGTGKKITMKPYTEKLNLDESLFEEKELNEYYNDFTTKEVIQFLSSKGFDVNDKRVQNYAEAVAEYIDLAREAEDGYSLEDWYKDTKMNYPEELEDLARVESLKEKKENKKESKHLCEDYNVREYSDQLYDMIEDDMVDAKKIAEDLIYWCSEDDIKEYMRVNDLIFDDEEYDESFHMNTGKYSRNESLEKKSLEDLNLLEYVNEEDVEDDNYTVYDLLNDRLFGYGINKSNFRVKWKFAEVEPMVKTRDGKLKRGYFYPTIHQDELTTGKRDDRRAFTEDGIGVFVHDEDEASLVKKCAEELNLDFVMKKLVRPHNGFNYVATIKVSDDIQEMPIKDYMESIGKSMSDLLRGKGDKIKSNFKDSKNYQSRKINKEQQETAE